MRQLFFTISSAPDYTCNTVSFVQQRTGLEITTIVCVRIEPQRTRFLLLLLLRQRDVLLFLSCCDTWWRLWVRRGEEKCAQKRNGANTEFHPEQERKVGVTVVSVVDEERRQQHADRNTSVQRSRKQRRRSRTLVALEPLHRHQWRDREQKYLGDGVQARRHKQQGRTSHDVHRQELQCSTHNVTYCRDLKPLLQTRHFVCLATDRNEGDVGKHVDGRQHVD
mmetsp:Transcript_32796/g.38042  ORF Transcript_32796/g.38042 Transcript_32796/m.38042 type:complete len:222 (+) Transcript_32796:928-1593(+)